MKPSGPSTAWRTRGTGLSATHAKRAGVEGRVVAADREGHTFSGDIETGVVQALPWLLDERFTRP